MKWFIILWVIFSLPHFAQDSFSEYRTIIKRVDKFNSETSQLSFPNQLKYTLSRNDSLKATVYNVNGDHVYHENFGQLDSGIYTIKFINPKAPGIYFVSSEIGNQPAFKKAIQITSETASDSEVEFVSVDSTSFIDGIWKRTYSESFVPAIQPASDSHQIEYRYIFDIQIIFSKGYYKIISERKNEEYNGKEIRTFEGKFNLAQDTLKLYENSKLYKVFHYRIEDEKIILSDFEIKDKISVELILQIPASTYIEEIKLTGEYFKIVGCLISKKSSKQY